jgi:hypothetical protein
MERIGECAHGPSSPGLELEQGLHVTGNHPSSWLATTMALREPELQKKENMARHTSAASVALAAGRVLAMREEYAKELDRSTIVTFDT